MIETTAAIVAIGTGAVILMASTISALGIIFTPKISSRTGRYGFSEEEYQDRIRHDYDTVHRVRGFRGYSRPFSPRATSPL
jgi:hypothetical protein